MFCAEKISEIEIPSNKYVAHVPLKLCVIFIYQDEKCGGGGWVSGILDGVL